MDVFVGYFPHTQLVGEIWRRGNGSMMLMKCPEPSLRGALRNVSGDITARGHAIEEQREPRADQPHIVVEAGANSRQRRRDRACTASPIRAHVGEQIRICEHHAFGVAR